jgi:hypothetical protein
MKPAVIASFQFWMLILALDLLLPACDRQSPAPAVTQTNASGPLSQSVAARVAQIEDAEALVNKTVWAKEMLAQECGHTFDDLWDALNAATNKLAVAVSFPVRRILLPQWQPPRALAHGIQFREPIETLSRTLLQTSFQTPSSTSSPPLSQSEWHELVDKLAAAGWRLVQTEFRHNRFDTDAPGQAHQSHFYLSAHLTNAALMERAILEGDMVVEWAPATGGQPPTVASMDASGVTLKTRRGEPPFQLVFTEAFSPIRNSKSIDPLIVYDLDGDGVPEIILAALNKVYRRRSDGTYQPEPLCKYPPGVVYSAVMGDFDNDGAVDFLCQKYEGLVLYKGSHAGTFDEPGRLVWPAPREMRYPMVLTCGDIDHDGDLDVFVAQYKLPYEGGQMPSPYFDANDGYPSYLLLNDGHGNFTDATVRAGLSGKAHRRSYGASFADLNGDGHLDLLVVSDFAGVDVYRNDGQGHFTDMTQRWLPETHLFGMAETVGDFNADGRLDFFVSGMPSPTADRLDHFCLWRPDAHEDPSMRSRMSHGNRLYIAKPSGGFEEISTAAGVARSGWSWGCVAADFDNDGFPDLFVANGMESRESVREYEGEFWLHDAYVGASEDDPAVDKYLQAKVTRVRGKHGSYGGYESSKLFLNQAGGTFLDVAYLFGVGLQRDGRNVMADDLDGDGRIDLVMTGYEPWPNLQQRIWVFKNTVAENGNWIGFRFREGGKGLSPIGVKVAVQTREHRAVQQLVTGDCYRSQRGNTVHFGLGTLDHVDTAEIQWPSGDRVLLRSPDINRYHLVQAPAR